MIEKHLDKRKFEIWVKPYFKNLLNKFCVLWTFIDFFLLHTVLMDNNRDKYHNSYIVGAILGCELDANTDLSNMHT